VAARVVAMRAEEVFEYSGGVLDTADIERVHDMRVATRRLRAALEVFAPCFPAKRHRKALRGVKALADALGERRDPDVQLELLEGLEGELEEADVEGFAKLIGRVRKEQTRANRELGRQVAEKRLAKLRRRLGRLVEGEGS